MAMATSPWHTHDDAPSRSSPRHTHDDDAAAVSRSSPWHTILGPFDLYGAAGNDPLQRSRRDLVVQIFRLVDYPENLEVSVAALHVIADMSESPVFAASSPHSPHKLYSILETAGELPTVMEAFLRRLEREETEKAYLFGNSLDMEDSNALADFGLANLVRLQIIEFLIRNAARRGYNLAHFLLGFSTDLLSGSVTRIAPPSEAFTCLHLILEVLAYCLGQPGPPAVILEHPSFGMRCYELLAVLMHNPKTSKAAANHLRDQEDFFRKQLAFAGREPVSLPEAGYTVYEMQAKAALLKGAILDLHLAVAEGAWGYVKKLATVLVRGVLGDAKAAENALDAGQSLVAVMIGSVEAVLNPEYLSSNIPEIREQLLLSAGLLVRSCSKVSQLMLATLDRVPYDRQAMATLQTHLVTSLVPVIGRLLQNASATAAVLEQCAALTTALAGGFFRRTGAKEHPSSSPLLAGDELSALAAAAIVGIVRNDSNLSSRGYLYAAICDALETLEGPELDALKGLIKRDLPRLLEASASDSVVPSTDADGWKTMATAFLRTLVSLVSDAAPLDRLARFGFLKNLIASLRNDDRSVLQILNPACQNLNSLYLWRARFSLLQIVACEPHGGERLVEAGLIDILTSFRIFERHSSSSSVTSSESPAILSVVEQRWHLIMLPVVRLLLLLSGSPTPAVSANARSLVRSHAVTFEELLRRTKGRLPSSGDHLELIAKTAQLLAQLNDPNSFPLFAHLLSRALASCPEGEWDEHILGIVSSCISLFCQAMVKDSSSSLVPIAFAESTTETCISQGHVTVDLLVRCLDGALASLAKGLSDRLLSILEGILLILSLAVSRHAPRDSIQRDRDIRQLSAAASPSLEQLQGVIGRESGAFKEQIGLLECLLRDLRGCLAARPPPSDTFN